MTTARVLAPDVRVRLHKNIKRSTINGGEAARPVAQRFKDAERIVHLDQYLGEGCSVTTTKNVRSPFGTFQITLVDRPAGVDAATLESLYGMIEPMDGIEIRMSHNQGRRSREPPVVMRGFVGRVTRSQGVDEAGRPQRRVIITGQDYGRWWEMLKVLHRPQWYLDTALISSFKLFERFGVPATNMPASVFVREMIEKIINPHLAAALPEDWKMPKALTVEAIVGEGLTSLGGPQGAEGSIYSICAEFLDVSNGFNELFIEDRQETVTVVFRPNPALDLDEKPIQRMAAYQAPQGPAAADGTAAPSEPADRSTIIAPLRLAVPASDIQEMTLGRSDEAIANYFWTEGARFELVRGITAQGEAIGAARASVFDEAYPNNNPRLYGLRPMIVASQMGPSASFQPTADGQAMARREQDATRWLDERRRVLMETNRDSAVFETGHVRLAGNEMIRAGCYLEMGQGALAGLFYVSSVTHTYAVFQGFFTEVEVERGMGFAKRVQSGGQVGPWLIEMGAGAQGASPTAPPLIGQAAAAEASASPVLREELPPPSTIAQPIAGED